MAFNYGNEEQGLSSLPENSHGKVVGEFSLNYPMHQMVCIVLSSCRVSQVENYSVIILLITMLYDL